MPPRPMPGAGCRTGAAARALPSGIPAALASCRHQRNRAPGRGGHGKYRILAGPGTERDLWSDTRSHRSFVPLSRITHPLPPHRYQQHRSPPGMPGPRERTSGGTRVLGTAGTPHLQEFRSFEDNHLRWYGCDSLTRALRSARRALADQRPRVDRDGKQPEALDGHPDNQVHRRSGRNQLGRTTPQRSADRLAHPPTHPATYPQNRPAAGRND
jgi:hypothetical protein